MKLFALLLPSQWLLAPVVTPPLAMGIAEARVRRLARPGVHSIRP